MGSALSLSSDNESGEENNENNYRDDDLIYQNINDDRFKFTKIDKLQSSLIRSSRRGDIQKVQRILSKNSQDFHININTTDGAANTPLVIAAKEGHFEIVKYLLQMGACAEGIRENSTGWTPLWVATFSGHSECVRILIQAGANIETNSPDTPLMLAAREGQADCLQLLIQAGAKLNTHNANKQNPLHLACEECNIECVEILLKQGFDVNAVDKLHRTPLYLTCSNCDSRAIECIQLLLRYNLVVDIADCHGRTPLHVSASIGAYDAIVLLLELGADPKCMDKFGKRPSNLASSHPLTLKLLHDAEDIPMSLINFCRLKIRKLVKKSEDRMSQLPIPTKLIQFLNFSS
ncbi:Ankyrin repeat and SOCS box protein 13 [Trichoplax sp. H2]|nr:Ankyrin repeat and SOCS box protein 13 [Trichoplax sp. H2]|eukprot:RDD42055.1 Ankyrin repeat and SOCS box protein 13 [Trichoplax sp. H2]